jgi:hypothetical protein
MDLEATMNVLVFVEMRRLLVNQNIFTILIHKHTWTQHKHHGNATKTGAVPRGPAPFSFGYRCCEVMFA